MKTISFVLTGTRPLIPHNGQLADPLNKFSKASKSISGKKNKTDDDYEQLAKLEFMGSLYLNENLAPCVPGDNVEGTLREAAKKSKKGKSALSGIICSGLFDLEYKGSKKPEELWKDREKFAITCGVKIKKSRIMRTRPIFKEWSCKVEVQYNEGLLNQSDVIQFMEVAGKEIGLCDWRPKYGLFDAKVVK